MTKLANAGQATLPSGTGGVAIDVGFAPKAVLIWITGVANAGTPGGCLHYSAGCIEGSNKRYRVIWSRTDNAANNASARIGDNAVGYFDAQLIDASLSGNTLTLTPGGSLTASATVTWQAIGGTSVSTALRSLVFTNGTTTSVTDCGFDPTLVLTGSGGNATINTTTVAGSGVAIGATVSGTSRAAGFGTNPQTNTTCVAVRFMTNRSVNTYAFSAWRANTITVSLVTGGFSVNNTDTQTGWMWALCVAGLDVAVLSGALATSAGNVDLTGAGFTPSTALLFGLPDTTADDTNGNATASTVVGVVASDGTQAGVSLIHGFDTQRSGVHRASASAGLVTSEKTGTATYADKASATASFLADGIRYAFSAGHGAAGRFAVVLTDAVVPSSGPSPAAIHDYLTLNGLVPGV